MSQGAFIFYTSGKSTVNYPNDTDFAYLGGTPFNGPPVDWTQVVIGYTVDPAINQTLTFTSDWTLSGTGGSGKILSVSFYRGPAGGRSVIITLQTGGGAFTDGVNYLVSPPTSCFVQGTRVLTQNGYKPIETLMAKDMMVLSDGRIVDYDMKKIVVNSATTATAPYRIEAGAFGTSKPSADLCLSPTHKIQIRKGVWISPERAAKTNDKVYQYGIGDPVSYWHIACADYLKDNLMCEGLVVESLATNKNYTGPSKVYTWSDRLGGFTRVSKVLKQLAL